jgi:hypothetical protein
LGWEEYIVSDEAEVDWIERSITYQDEVNATPYIKDYGRNFRNDTFHSIKTYKGNNVTDKAVPLIKVEEGYIPFWEMSPFLSFDEVNIDMLQDERGLYGLTCLEEGVIVVGNMTYQEAGGIDSMNRRTSTYAQLLSIDAEQTVEYQGDPMSYIFVPIFDSFESGRTAKSLLVGLFNWGILFRDVLPRGVTGIDIVIKNSCNESFTYRLVGSSVGTSDVLPLGQGVSCCCCCCCCLYSNAAGVDVSRECTNSI